MIPETVIINGKPVRAVVFGDGQEQIDFFNSVADYAQQHKLEIKTHSLDHATSGRQQTLITGQDEKYTIQVKESKIPGIKPPLHYPSYLSIVLDNETGKKYTYYGTISHCFWDLLHELKDKQK